MEGSPIREVLLASFNFFAIFGVFVAALYWQQHRSLRPSAYPETIYAPPYQVGQLIWLVLPITYSSAVFLLTSAALLTGGIPADPRGAIGLMVLFAAFIGLLVHWLWAGLRERARRRLLYDLGVEVEAEVLAAGQTTGGRTRDSWLEGYEPMKWSLPWSWRVSVSYVFEGERILSSSRVSSELFYRSRKNPTLKIRVDSDKPWLWVPAQ